MKFNLTCSVFLFTFLYLTSCGQSGGVPDVRRPEWDPQPADPNVSPDLVDASLPLPAAADISFPLPPSDGLTSATLPVLVVDKKVLRFESSPLYAIFIYEGIFQNYDEAIVTANPVASVPANQDCTQVEGRCWQSPLVITFCKDCDKLDATKTYSAFLLRQSSEPLHKVLMVPVVFE